MIPAVTISDTISPGLAAAMRRVQDPTPVLRAMGLQLLSLTQDSFNNPGLRAAPWPAKRDGTPATLRRHQTLFKAWRLGPATRDSITLSNDRKYAAIHQLGGTTRAHVIKAKFKKALAWPGGPGPRKAVRHPGSRMPARPMLPFIMSGTTPRLADFARTKLERIGQAKLDALLRGPAGR